MLRSCTVWFTGLPCSGKTTIARNVSALLTPRGQSVELLDGDVLRRTLSRDLGFSEHHRREHIRRVTSLAQSLTAHGAIALVSVIAPYRDMRAEIRRKLPGFVEVYVNASLQLCESRDVKGLYRRARAGELKGLTGIDEPYEYPEAPEVECSTGRESPLESAAKVVAFLDRYRIAGESIAIP